MPNGFLAIWSDISPENETDYLHWFSREHALERLSVPGFHSVRMFRALDIPERRYFILYCLENAGVVSSEAYLQRLNRPTPWSQRIMPLLGNFGAAAAGRRRRGARGRTASSRPCGWTPRRRPERRNSPRPGSPMTASPVSRCWPPTTSGPP